jgi:medium-chain acyl-[acyl-carrier-protein] hydrolase
MEERQQDLNSPWFESVSRTRDPLIRLFCFPHAGGTAHAFREWQRHFGVNVDVCLVHLPGRARRLGERPRTRLRPLVEELADAIRANLDRPFAFYGHSMGALISFELARELRRRRWPLPAHLFVSACRSPIKVGSVPPSFNLPVDEFMALLQKLNGTPKEFYDHAEIQVTLLPMLRADFELTDTYEYLAESPLDCPITIYGGKEDHLASPESLYSWDLETSAEYRLRLFGGDHFFIHSQKTEFLAALQRDLLEAVTASSISEESTLPTQ